MNAGSSPSTVCMFLNARVPLIWIPQKDCQLVEGLTWIHGLLLAGSCGNLRLRVEVFEFRDFLQEYSCFQSNNEGTPVYGAKLNRL